MAQEVGSLPSMHKAQSVVHSTVKQNQNTLFPLLKKNCHVLIV
jgi:hypothetical protein